MRIGLLYRVLIHDKNGKLVRKTKWRKSKSFVIAFLQHIYGAFIDTDVSAIDTSNASRPIKNPSYGTVVRNKVDAGDNVSTFGVVVGTGITAPTNTDYALETQIAHGLGAGQLDYGAHSFTAPTEVAGNIDMVVSRGFYNGSGDVVTVREIGIYCQTFSDLSIIRYFCIIRDVLAAAQEVLNTQTLTVQYTLRTTV